MTCARVCSAVCGAVAVRCGGPVHERGSPLSTLHSAFRHQSERRAPWHLHLASNWRACGVAAWGVRVGGAGRATPTES